MRPLTLSLVETDTTPNPLTCTPEERTVLDAINAEEAARELAEQAVHGEIDSECEAKVQALGERRVKVKVKGAAG